MAWKNYRDKSTPTPVSLSWNTSLGMYSLIFANTNHWDEMQECIRTLKQMIPLSERDYTGPPEYTWYIHEKWSEPMRVLLENIKVFDFTFIGKPEGQTSTVKYIPTDIYLASFTNLSGVDVKDMEFGAAKKIYFKTSMKLHPDRNNGDGSKMTELNVAWEGLQIQHFKTKQAVTEMTEV